MLEFYDVIDSVRKQYVKASSELEKKYGLTNLEYNIIMFLADYPEKDTATSIVEKRDYCKSHVSMAVCSLQKKKYIVGIRQKNDRRTVHLKLTEKAQAVVDEGHSAQLSFANMALAGFSEDDRERLITDIVKIRQNIKDSER